MFLIGEDRKICTSINDFGDRYVSRYTMPSIGQEAGTRTPTSWSQAKHATITPHPDNQNNPTSLSIP